MKSNNLYTEWIKIDLIALVTFMSMAIIVPKNWVYAEVQS